MYRFRPITIKDANVFVGAHHRHNKGVQGGKFAISVLNVEGQVVGVGIAGRPVSRNLDDGQTLEITRVCVLAGNRNVCSMLYSRIAKIGRLMGYTTIITYTLCSESGASLRAVGALPSSMTRSAVWHRKLRPRGNQNVYHVPKIRWRL